MPGSLIVLNSLRRPFESIRSDGSDKLMILTVRNRNPFDDSGASGWLECFLPISAWFPQFPPMKLNGLERRRARHDLKELTVFFKCSWMMIWRIQISITEKWTLLQNYNRRNADNMADVVSLNGRRIAQTYIKKRLISNQRYFGRTMRRYVWATILSR